jgi:SAM-dependent methyltransferase
MTESTKNEVREFYDKIGWSLESDGFYQNARYEDLRPVVQDYIHNCHLRVNRHIARTGKFFLDAGSGPVQWAEYLTFSEGFQYRVCADISITALREARKRLGEKGLYVVMDIANLPFKPDAFDALTSMHTIHHISVSEHRRAYMELHRVLKPGKTGVVVNGWTNPPLMRVMHTLVDWLDILRGRRSAKKDAPKATAAPTGTFINKTNAPWLVEQLKDVVPFEIFCWRSVSTRFTRSLIFNKLAGRAILRFIYWLEERFPRWFGENGQYPLVVIRKECS